MSVMKVSPDRQVCLLATCEGLQVARIDEQAGNLAIAMPGFRPRYDRHAAKYLEPTCTLYTDAVVLVPTHLALARYWGVSDPYSCYSQLLIKMIMYTCAIRDWSFCIVGVCRNLHAPRLSVDDVFGRVHCQLDDSRIRLHLEIQPILQALEAQAEAKGYNCLVLPAYLPLPPKEPDCEEPVFDFHNSHRQAQARHCIIPSNVQTLAMTMALPGLLRDWRGPALCSADEYRWGEETEHTCSTYLKVVGHDLLCLGARAQNLVCGCHVYPYLKLV